MGAVFAVVFNTAAGKPGQAIQGGEVDHAILCGQNHRNCGVLAVYFSLASTMSMFVEAIGVIMFGVVLAYAGMRLFAEYRRAFFANPRAIMTLDVVVQILKCGIGPVYLSAVCLFGAGAFIFAGIGILVLSIFETLHRMGWL